jgi:rare lipoprotein A
MMYRYLLLACVVLLTACTETQYVAQMSKEWSGTVSDTPTQQGTFKIGNPYKVEGRTYTPKEQYDLVETGIASWYGPGFDGKKTANGEIFDKRELTAAHRTLQMPSLVRVTNLDNGRSIIVRINDRGPFKRNRVIDVSEKSAELLGFKGNGTAKVKLEVLQQESLRVAQAARMGESTRGYEVAMNESPGDVLETVAYDTSSGSVSVQPVSSEMLTAPSEVGAPVQTALPGHIRNGEFYPDPVVQERPVTRTNIFVQAGAFSVYENATKLRDKLSAFDHAVVKETDVRGQHFYRVRLGPVGSVDQADQLLNRVVNSGHKDAIIVVE